MLLKIERTILKRTSSSQQNSISLAEIGNYNGEDVYQVFLGLKEKGYFNIVNASVDRLNFSYVLTAKGRYYKENLRMEFVKNILIPFIVALITSTATYHLEKVADEYSNNSTNNSRYDLNNDSE